MCSFRLVLNAIILFALVFQYILAHECQIISTNKTEFREPLFLVKSSNNSSKYEFFIPDSNELNFKANQDIYVACPHGKNILLNSNTDIEKATCKNGKLHISGQVLESTEQLQCNKSIRGTVRIVNKRCANNAGFLYEIGFKLGENSERTFLSLIKVCYNQTVGSTLYTEHIIHGRSIYNASKAKFRPSFSTDGLKISAAIAYKQVFQRGTFSKLLGSSFLVDKYINNKSYLSRGHLAPDADFQFAPWQYATYFYLNVCPQWQAINGGNWHKAEAMTRRTAGHLGEDLHIVTGTHEVLTVPNLQGRPTPLYLLPDRKLPVPKFNWKVLYRTTRREAIVFVILNNPFVTNITRDDYLCSDVCDKYGWGHAHWRMLDRGMLHCCEFNEFAQSVQHVPKLHVNGILYGNSNSKH